MSVDANSGNGESGSSPGSRSKNSDGPGEWVSENQSGRSDRAKAYEAQISGRTGEAYSLNGVDFDGFDGENLLEAKGPGYSNLLDRNGEWQDWAKGTGVQELLKQANRQLGVAGSRTVVWHVAEPDAALAIQKLFAQNKINIRVVNTLPLP